MITQSSQTAKPVRRQVKLPPRTFDHFPVQDFCPVCGSNDDGVCVLVPIVGTQEGFISQAKPFHLACAVAEYYDREHNLIYRRTAEALPVPKV